MKHFLSLFKTLLIASLVLVGCNDKNEDTTKEVSLTESERSDLKAKGMQLAGETQKVLGSNLIKAISEGGPVNALEFCNISAHPLTDSMATALKAHITRVTDKPRNPNNMANEHQLTYIASAKQELAAGNKIEPVINVVDGKVTGYYPIITNQMCMQCHGSENDQINESTLAKLKELYPDDRARGYGVGELRGIWVVEMDSE